MGRASHRLFFLILTVACVLSCAGSLFRFFCVGGTIPLVASIVFIIFGGLFGGQLASLIQQRNYFIRERMRELNLARRQNHQRELYFDEEEEVEIRRRKKINNVKIIEED